MFIINFDTDFILKKCTNLFSHCWAIWAACFIVILLFWPQITSTLHQNSQKKLEQPEKNCEKRKRKKKNSFFVLIFFLLHFYCPNKLYHLLLISFFLVFPFKLLYSPLVIGSIIYIGYTEDANMKILPKKQKQKHS